MAIERWNHDEREHRAPWLGQAFVSVDPGGDGWALGWIPEQSGPIALCHAYDPDALLVLFRHVRARVAVVEGQFMGNPALARSVLDLSFRTGMSLGWVGAMMHYDVDGAQDLNLFQVAPSTWQAHQRRLAGIPGKLPRAEGMELSLAMAFEVIGREPEWINAPKKQKEGLASAFGIGIWWRSLS